MSRIRIHYDVGLGREFAAEELLSEEPLADNGRSNRPATGAWCGPATSGSRPKTAPAIPCRHLSGGDNR